MLSDVATSELFPCRLFIDPPAEGAWNMAVDEALLEQAADEGLAALRFYQWSEPTLSLGYFQRYAERDAHAASRDATVVRRLSGGGALVHDRELTYSLCLPASHPFARSSAELYATVHTALIKVLAARGVTAVMHCAAPPVAPMEADPPGEPFLCFARRSAADVILATVHDKPDKIVGSAKRRRRGAVLQHGAVLLAASSRAPELIGIERLGGLTLAPDELIEPWSARIGQRLNLQLTHAHFSSSQSLQLRNNNLLKKHASAAWLQRR